MDHDALIDEQQIRSVQHRRIDNCVRRNDLEQNLNICFFSEIFASKSVLLQQEENEYTEIYASHVQQTCEPLLPEDDAAKRLCVLRIDSLTGTQVLSIWML